MGVLHIDTQSFMIKLIYTQNNNRDIFNMKYINLCVGATKTGSALVALVCCMFAKSNFFMHSKEKEVRSSAQIVNLS